MKKQEKENPYADIINLPRHVSEVYPQMPVANRAAQFSPFAALTGHSAAVREATRPTEAKRELGEYDRDILDRKLRILQEWQGGQPEIAVTYFRPDARKEGGEYVTVSGRLKKIKIYDGVLILADGCGIAFDDIAEISGGNTGRILNGIINSENRKK